MKVSLGYLDASSDALDGTGKEVDQDFSRYMGALAYEYPLSKRTTLYTAAGYIQDDVADRNPSWVHINCGITHKF